LPARLRLLLRWASSSRSCTSLLFQERRKNEEVHHRCRSSRHLAIAATAAASDYYKVNVSRKDKDLYLDHNSGVYIVTEYCYVYAAWDDALLKWDGYSGKLHFDEVVNSTCDVKKLISK
jgi:hypothetical protein